MNYQPNAVTWPVGSLVLHDCDAKRTDMLLRVVRYLPDGRVRAEYVNVERRKRQLHRVRGRSKVAGWFDLCDLHDPSRFGVRAAVTPTAYRMTGG